MKFLILCTIPLFIFGLTPSNGYDVGDEAANFNLKSVSGEYISFDSYPDAKGYVVIFTCNHCPYAKAYEERIIELHDKYAPLGFPVIAINPNDPNRVPEDSYEAMQERAREKSYPFEYLFDESQQVSRLYGPVRTPHVFLIDKKEKNEVASYVVAYIGAIDDSAMSAGEVKKKYLENAINALLNGEHIDPDYTVAIGCKVKWKND